MDKSKKNNKLKPLEELLLLTKGKCLLSFEEDWEFDKMSYHHLKKRAIGGPRSFDNGAPLLRSNHDFLNIIEMKDRNLYCELNCAMDAIKEALSMEELLRNIYTEKSIANDYSPILLEDLSSVDIDEIDETMEVDYYSKEQLIEIRKAIKIYKEEVVPAFMEAKQMYADGELYQCSFEDLIPLRKEKKIITA